MPGRLKLSSFQVFSFKERTRPRNLESVSGFQKDIIYIRKGWGKKTLSGNVQTSIFFLSPYKHRNLIFFSLSLPMGESIHLYKTTNLVLILSLRRQGLEQWENESFIIQCNVFNRKSISDSDYLIHIHIHVCIQDKMNTCQY